MRRNRQGTKHQVVSCELFGWESSLLGADLEAFDWPGQRRSRHYVNLPRNLGKVSQGTAGDSPLVFAIW